MDEKYNFRINGEPWSISANSIPKDQKEVNKLLLMKIITRDFKKDLDLDDTQIEEIVDKEYHSFREWFYRCVPSKNNRISGDDKKTKSKPKLEESKVNNDEFSFEDMEGNLIVITINEIIPIDDMEYVSSRRAGKLFRKVLTTYHDDIIYREKEIRWVIKKYQTPFKNWLNNFEEDGNCNGNCAICDDKCCINDCDNCEHDECLKWPRKKHQPKKEPKDKGRLQYPRKGIVVSPNITQAYIKFLGMFYRFRVNFEKIKNDDSISADTALELVEENIEKIQAFLDQ